MKNWFQKNWLKLTAVLMLLGAFLSSFYESFAPPFAYYQLMNWAVVGGALMNVLSLYKENKQLTMWLFVLVAVVFNPISSIYLSAVVWQVADAVVTLFFIFFLMKPKAQLS